MAAFFGGLVSDPVETTSGTAPAWQALQAPWGMVFTEAGKALADSGTFRSTRVSSQIAKLRVRQVPPVALLSDDRRPQPLAEFTGGERYG
jgi:hypothetical protein